MADKAPTVVATSQSNNASKKALRHAKKAKKKATETAASQSESRAETAIDLDEKVDIYAIEKRIHEKAAQRVADQKAYWNLLVEEFKADDPNYDRSGIKSSSETRVMTALGPMTDVEALASSLLTVAKHAKLMTFLSTSVTIKFPNPPPKYGDAESNSPPSSNPNWSLSSPYHARPQITTAGTVSITLEQADLVRLLAPDQSPDAWSQVLWISLRQSDESQSNKNSIHKCSHSPNNFDCRVFIILRAEDNCLPIWTDFNSDVATLHHSQGLPISDATALPDAT
ncbi:hypothetical protein HG530_012597 [Fusarium avenaceum]|nr:hypothetical protein HG530_012597 [Fusarium avenaceum]